MFVFCVIYDVCGLFFFSSRRRHTRCALVTGVQTCALPIFEIMSPAFAMGPAWTLMRSLSAHVSDEEADKATDIFVGAEKIESMARYRQIRARETGEMFDALDWLDRKSTRLNSSH